MTFTIDPDNNITAHAAVPAAQDTLAAFASQKELSKTTAEWPISRLVETWNSFAGAPPFGDLKPVKKFENRAKATARIWAAIQKLQPSAPQAATPAPQAAPKPAKKAKATKATKAAAGAPTPAQAIASEAAANGATLVDIYSLINDLAANGVVVGGQKLTTDFMGGLFSLDGVHPTNTGYAIIANEFIKTMNRSLRAGIPPVSVERVSQTDPLIFPGNHPGRHTGHVDVGMADGLRHLGRR